MYRKCISEVNKLKGCLSNFSIDEGFSEDFVQSILHDEYKMFNSSNDLIKYGGSLLLKDKLHFDSFLANDSCFNYELNDKMKKYLIKNNFTYDNLFSIYAYLEFYEMFLNYKEGQDKKVILSKIIDKFITSLKLKGYSYEKINKVIKFVLNRSRVNDEFLKYDLVKEFCLNIDMNTSDLDVVFKFLDNINCYNNIDCLIYNLDIVTKRKIGDSVLLYKYMDESEFVNKYGQLDNLINKKVSLSGYTKASTMFSNSVDKEMIFELYTPEKTEGLLLSPFMDLHDDTLLKGDFLLNLSNMYIFDSKKIVISNVEKTLVKGLVLSNNVSVYNEITDDKIKVLK